MLKEAELQETDIFRRGGLFRLSLPVRFSDFATLIPFPQDSLPFVLQVFWHIDYDDARPQAQSGFQHVAPYVSPFLVYFCT